MVTLCIECKKFVNKRQEALLCDGCNKWQHRTCSSGVSRDMYRNAVRSGEDIPWRCKPCSTLHPPRPNFESTRNEGNYHNNYYECHLYMATITVRLFRITLNSLLNLFFANIASNSQNHLACLNIRLKINSFRWLTWNSNGGDHVFGTIQHRLRSTYRSRKLIIHASQPSAQ